MSITYSQFIKKLQIVESEIHPKEGEYGDSVEIRYPTTPSPMDHWFDPKKHATVTPNGEMPESLNGLKFKPWEDAPKSMEEWNNVDGQGEFDEPHIEVPPGKRLATGAIIHEPDGRIWTISPTNSFGGYRNTIGPKGKLDRGMNTRANAIKEAFEETGLKVHLTGFAHDSNRTTSMTRYYHAKRVGGHPSDMGWETQAVHLVPKESLDDHLDSSLDREIARKL